MSSNSQSLVGVSLSGLEFGAGVGDVAGTNYYVPSSTEVNYFASKGMNVVRVPFSWDRLQPITLSNGLPDPALPLDTAYLGYLRNIVNAAAAVGVQVILDCHNYGMYDYNGPTDLVIGNNKVLHTAADYAAFQVLWNKIATEFKSNDNVIFGLMNEPLYANTSSAARQWLEAVNWAVDGITAAGATQQILISSPNWDHADNFVGSEFEKVISANLNSGQKFYAYGNYAFEFHQYMDSDGSGTHIDPITNANRGVTALTSVTNWAATNNVRLFLGETNVPDDPTSQAALANLISYVSQNSAVWQGLSYWSANKWVNDNLSDPNRHFDIWPSGSNDDPQLTTIRNSAILQNDIHYYYGTTNNDIIKPSNNWQKSSILGQAGNDYLFGGTNSDTLDGGAGNDTLIGDGPVVLTDNALAVRRLYFASLNRGPDDQGWASWTAALDGGQTVAGIAAGFVGSAEFQSKYGALDNPGYVTLLYNNVLHRASDAGGLAGWVNALNNGMTRAEVLVGFSESAEFKISSDIDYEIGQVYRLYGATFGRQPDTGGFQDWVGAVTNGMSITTAAAGFAGSAEFQAKYGALDNTAFTTMLYNNVLNRAPDSAGLASWVNALNAGMSRASVILGFSDSAEYIGKTTPALNAYMQTAVPAWNDTLEGGSGNDKLCGGMGADNFVFRAGQGGVDDIYYYESWDSISLLGFGYANAAAATAHMTQSGSNVIFADQGESLTIHGTTLGQIQVKLT